MRNLSPIDQILFERFGKGVSAEVPYETLHSAFEAHAAAQPHAIAAHHLDQSITYGELDRQANRLAATLARHGVVTGDNVALFLQRSIPMLVGIMGALKAGASYVPQHVGVAPEAHLKYVIETAKTKVILTLSHLQNLIPVPEGHTVIAVDEFMQTPFAENDFIAPFMPVQPVSRDNICNIIFTSGTTGNPNGVQVTHGNIGNIVLTEPGNLGMRPGVKVGQILSIAFDMAAWEILGSLGNGATLVIRGKEFMQAVKQVDVVISTPSILSTFDADAAHNVKVVAVAGEPCPRPLADKWSQFSTFYNACGPTETTIVNTMQDYKPWRERLTIGAPTPNNTVYVLDENLKPCAIGEIGEMWAGGDCVSAGYIGNDDLTAARYVPDPFLGGGRMMFRTRDLGRWTAYGELEHFGRTDDQVKVRGFRVELDSVSGVLENVAHCKRAVTLKLDSRHLVGFVSPLRVDVEAAKQAVAAALPYYCTPKFIVALEELPMTSRGKIDKRQLMQLAVELDSAENQEQLESAPC
ncbi:MAG: amino acid adenylation domain-containing protein [Anaerolineae bacterium]|nr:amino acid adenylation domain-containing protein [Anaerolineae bacterium]